MNAGRTSGSNPCGSGFWIQKKPIFCPHPTISPKIASFVKKIGTNHAIRDKTARFSVPVPSQFVAERRAHLLSAAPSARRSSVLNSDEVSICAGTWTRTKDRACIRRLLYQLSYTRIATLYFLLSTMAIGAKILYYQQMTQEDLAKNRTDLAKDRTLLANQRTFLSYMRTTLAVVALAVLIFKFTPIIIGIPLGTITMAFALILFLYGIKSYKTMNSKISGN